jgi:hypothetical protein
VQVSSSGPPWRAWWGGFLASLARFDGLITSSYRLHSVALSVWHGTQTRVLKRKARSSHEGTDTGRNEADLGRQMQKQPQFGPGLIARIVLGFLFFDFGADMSRITVAPAN